MISNISRTQTSSYHKIINPPRAEEKNKKNSKDLAAVPDWMKEQIKEIAKKDVSENTYMGGGVGGEFIKMRQAYLKEHISPDRDKYKGLLQSKLSSFTNKSVKEIDYFLLLIDPEYKDTVGKKGKVAVSLGDAGNMTVSVGSSRIHADIYDENGENIISFNSVNGWIPSNTKAELLFYGATSALYSAAHDEAEAEINAQKSSQSGKPPSSNSTLDIKI